MLIEIVQIIYSFADRCTQIVLSLAYPKHFKIGRYRLCDSAAREGHLNLLIWARENGHPWSYLTTTAAAIRGDLEIVKFLINIGCDHNYDVCKYAVIKGNLEMLKFARDNDCGWNIDVCAHGHSKKDIHKYLIMSNCPCKMRDETEDYEEYCKNMEV